MTDRGRRDAGRARRRLRGLPLLAIAVGVSLSAAGCASSSPQTASVADVPAARSTTQSATSTEDGRQFTLVTIGDSIMSGFGLDEGEDWPDLLATSRGWDLLNLSEPGAGFLSVGSEGGIFADQAEEAEELVDAPSLILVSASTNDWGEDPDDIRDAALPVFESLRQAFPAARLVGMSAIWGSDEPDEGLVPLNDAVEEAALASGAEWIDVGEPLLGLPDLMQDDDVHPTAEGQQVMADAVAGLLEPLLADDRAAAGVR